MHACFSTTETVKSWLTKLEKEGCTVTADYNKGVIHVTDSDGNIVYKGIQKSRAGDWIVSCFDTKLITWK